MKIQRSFVMLMNQSFCDKYYALLSDRRESNSCPRSHKSPMIKLALELTAPTLYTRTQQRSTDCEGQYLTETLRLAELTQT